MRRSTSQRSFVPRYDCSPPSRQSSGFDLLPGVLSREAQIEQLHRRYAAGTLGREGPFFAGVGGVDHASALVRRNRDAAAEVRHDETQSTCKACPARARSAWRLPLSSAHAKVIDAPATRCPRAERFPATRPRSPDRRRKPVTPALVGQRVRQIGAEIRSVLAAFRQAQFVEHCGVHLVGSAGQRRQQTAASDNRAEFGDAHAACSNSASICAERNSCWSRMGRLRNGAISASVWRRFFTNTAVRSQRERAW